MERLDRRQGFLVSAVVHMMILTILSSGPFGGPADPKASESEPPRVSNRLFLPPPEVLREMLPSPPPPPKPAATPAPSSTPPETKDRISVGPPSRLRATGPLMLRRDDDLTQVQKGSPDAVPTPAPTPTPAPRQTRRADSGDGGQGRDKTERSDGFRLPEMARPEGSGGTGNDRELEGPSIAESLRNLDDRLRNVGQMGLPSGTGKRMGPLFFDPRGADFTSWINYFKDEVYRNWIVPQAALMGFRGHVDLEFSVERDGRMTGLRMLKSSGTPSLDRAAQNALISSRFLPLPSDYGPPRVTMQVTFYYNEAPQGT